jgi:hypothetical protein
MLWARRGFLPEAADKINAATPEILKLPEFVDRMRIEAAQPLVATRAELWERAQRDAKFMDDAARAAKYEPQ